MPQFINAIVFNILNPVKSISVTVNPEKGGKNVNSYSNIATIMSVKVAAVRIQGGYHLTVHLPEGNVNINIPIQQPASKIEAA